MHPIKDHRVHIHVTITQWHQTFKIETFLLFSHVFWHKDNLFKNVLKKKILHVDQVTFPCPPSTCSFFHMFPCTIFTVKAIYQCVFLASVSSHLFCHN